MKPANVRVALVGLGPIGIEVGKALAAREGVTLLGAADPLPTRPARPCRNSSTGCFRA